MAGEQATDAAFPALLGQRVIEMTDRLHRAQLCAGQAVDGRFLLRRSNGRTYEIIVREAEA